MTKLRGLLLQTQTRNLIHILLCVRLLQCSKAYLLISTEVKLFAVKQITRSGKPCLPPEHIHSHSTPHSVKTSHVLSKQTMRGRNKWESDKPQWRLPEKTHFSALTGGGKRVWEEKRQGNKLQRHQLTSTYWLYNTLASRQTHMH